MSSNIIDGNFYTKAGCIRQCQHPGAVIFQQPLKKFLSFFPWLALCISLVIALRRIFCIPVIHKRHN